MINNRVELPFTLNIISLNKTFSTSTQPWCATWNSGNIWVSVVNDAINLEYLHYMYKPLSGVTCVYDKDRVVMQ